MCYTRLVRFEIVGSIQLHFKAFSSTARHSAPPEDIQLHQRLVRFQHSASPAEGHQLIAPNLLHKIVNFKWTSCLRIGMDSMRQTDTVREARAAPGMRPPYFLESDMRLPSPPSHVPPSHSPPTRTCAPLLPLFAVTHVKLSSVSHCSDRPVSLGFQPFLLEAR